MLRCAAIAKDDRPVVDAVALDLEGRRKRRQAVTTEKGARVLIDLAEAPRLRHGDRLALDDGGAIEVRALSEELVEIATDDPVRIAWHLGNRHQPTEILAGGLLRIRRDHVIEAMLEGLGCHLRVVEAAFDPEGGAYAHRHAHD